MATKIDLCCVTGQRVECVARKEVILKTNCDQPWFAAPTSQWCSRDAALAFSHRPERASCWWTGGNVFKSIKRQEIRALVLEGSPSAPWALWVTTSYKKHGSIRARVNHGRYGIVAFDELVVDASDPEHVREWWNVLTTAQRAGIWRSMMERVECPPGLIGKIGLATWMALEAWARPRMRAPLYALLLYLLPSVFELKEGKI